MDWDTLLRRAATETGARAGVVWQVQVVTEPVPGRFLQPATAFELTAAQLSDDSVYTPMRQQLLSQALQTGSAHWGALQNGQPDTSQCIAFLPVAEAGEVTAVVELHLAQPVDDAVKVTLKNCMNRLNGRDAPPAPPIVAPPLSAPSPPFVSPPPFVPPPQPPPNVSVSVPRPPDIAVIESRPPLDVGVESESTTTTPAAVLQLSELLDWLLQLHRSLNLREIAQAAVNDGRLLLNVDRLSLAAGTPRRMKVIAVSGQERVHPRAEQVRSMRQLCRLVARTGKPLRFPEDIDHLPADVTAALEEFIEHGGTRYLLIVPLRAAPPLRKPDENSDKQPALPPEPPVVGALVVEQMTNGQPQPELLTHLDLMLGPLGAAVHTVQQHESLFLLPVWRVLGTIANWGGRHRGWAIGGLIAVAAFISAMIFVPWTYRVEANGRLMPVIQRDVFAPEDGQVVELVATGGKRVAAGDVLLRLRNDELQQELVTVRNLVQEKRRLISSLDSEYAEASKSADRTMQVQLRGKIAETTLEVRGLQERVKLLEERLERLTVRSAIAGVVTTFQVEQLLQSRPVTRGEVLLQVMDDRGDWRLELEVQEHRLGHLQRAQTDDPQRAVEFSLLTLPEKTYQGQLTTVATRTATSTEHGTVVEVLADLTDQRLPQRTIGAEVRARIDCGKKPLGYVWFGDLWEFVQRYAWW